MATIVWTSRQTPDPEASGDVCIQAKVNGKNVSVHVSREALDDFGVQRCKAKAEEKILASTQNAEPTSPVEVRTSDFQ